MAVVVTHGGSVPDYYFDHLLCGAGWMLGAAFFYVTCLPERWIPRHLDGRVRDRMVGRARR